MNAVIYARFSSHNQREESIEGQVRECRKYAEQYDLHIIEIYADRALSGKTDHRPEFQRMIRDSAKRRFQVVIMYTLDRFARNRRDSASYKYELRKNGVRIVYAKQYIPDTPEGIILESVLEGYAEYYSENLARNITRGLMENALQGKSVGGTTPLGYKRQDGRFVIDSSGAKAVRSIFDMYLSGKSAQDIIKWLNMRGYLTARGMPFNKNSLRTILTNEKYIGTYRYRDVVIEDCIPKIIDKDTFDRVQERVKVVSKAKAHYKGDTDYLLCTKAFCGYCGSPLIGECGTSKNGNVYNYYKCAARKRGKTCNKKIESKDVLEEIVVRETVKTILQPGVIESIADQAMKLLEKEAADNSLLKSLQSRLKETEAALSNMTKAIEMGIITPTTKARLLELEADKGDLLDKIAQEEAVRPVLDKEQIVYWLSSFMEGDPQNEEYRRRIIDTLLNRVDVFDNDDGTRRIVLTYNLSENRVSAVTCSCSDSALTPPPSLSESDSFQTFLLSVLHNFTSKMGIHPLFCFSALKQ